MRKLVFMSAVFILVFNSALAKNQPCSGKKGGIWRCEKEQIICHDGKPSHSKMTCQEWLSLGSKATSHPQDVKNSKNQKIKTWVDDAGVTHFSD